MPTMLRPRHVLCLVLAATGSIAQAAATAPAAAAADGKSRSFDLSGFSRVRVTGPDDVAVRKGAQFAVVATGAPEQLERLEIAVRDGELAIGRKRDPKHGWNINIGKPVKIAVTMPSISGAILTGSGNLHIDAAVGASFQTALTGSGDIDVGAITADAVQVELAGSGNIRLGGSTRQAAFALTGSGDIDTRHLQAGTLEVRLNGSGNVSAAASGHAGINLLGSGDVTVLGTNDCAISKRGNGEVRCRK